MSCGEKSLMLFWRCHQILSGFLALAPNVSSITSSANDKGDNEMIPGAVHKSPGICLKVKENPENSQLGDRLMKTVRPVIASNDRTARQERRRNKKTLKEKTIKKHNN